MWINLRRFSIGCLLAWAVLAVSSGGLLAQGVLVIEHDGGIMPIPRPILPQPRPRPIPTASYRVKAVEIDSSINDQQARVQISQTFQNTGSTVVNASFLFPLPPDAAIDHLTLMVDGKEYEGKLMPRDEARHIYEDYVRRSQDPALLEWMGCGVFQTSVFPIPPGAERKVTLEFTQLLRRMDLTHELLLPLATAKYSSQPLDKLTMRLAINTTAKLKNVYCPTYSVEVERGSDHQAIVTFNAENVVPAADLRLFFDIGEELIGASLLNHWAPGDDLGHFLLLVSPDIGHAGEESIPKDIVFVVDRSGSMSGEKINQVRESLKFVIERLNDHDRFNVITYSTNVEKFRPELELASEANKQAALGFANGIFAGGSTNISEAMSVALPLLADNERPSFVVFLTDGLPTAGETNEGKIVQICRDHAGSHVRILNLGVGYDVNSRLLERIADAVRGRSEYVRPSEDIEMYVSRLYRSIAAPVMTDVQVTIDQPDWDAAQGPLAQQLIPAQASDLFFGEQLSISGRYRGHGAVRVTVTGKVGSVTKSFEFPLHLSPQGEGNNQTFVAKFWAARRIGQIIDDIDLNGQQQELIDELVSLSTKYGIMTPYTSFLADDQPNGLAVNDARRARALATDSFGRLAETSGVAGVAQRDFSNRLQSAGGRGGAPAGNQPAQSSPSAAFGGVELQDIDEDRAVATQNVLSVGNMTLYRSGQTWVDASCREIQLDSLPDDVQRVKRFSDEYFELAAGNSVDENLAFARLEAGDQLLIKLRGRLVLID